MKSIACSHAKNEPTVYIYKLIGVELYLCNRCEKRLREKTAEQIKVEKEVDKLAMSHTWMKRGKKK